MFKATITHEPYFYIATRVGFFSLRSASRTDTQRRYPRTATKAQSRNTCCGNTKT